MASNSSPRASHLSPEILVVEDDRLLRIMVAETLEAEGMPTTGAAGADEGLYILGTQPTVKLVISDINMPGMNGFELLAKIKALYPHLKLMAISGRAHVSDNDLPADANFLAKPFTAFQLLVEVRRALAEVPETPRSIEH